MVVFAANAGAIVPAALDHMRLGHLWCSAVLASDDFGWSVGRRGGGHPVYGDVWRASGADRYSAVPGSVTVS
jgi:hypothetical protein